MIRAFLFALLFLPALWATAQPHLSSGVVRALHQRGQEPVAVNLYFADRVDMAALKASVQHLPVAERPRAVERILRQHAEALHQGYRQRLVGHGTWTEISSSWLVNMLSLEVPPSLLRELAADPALAYIQLYDEEVAFLHEPVAMRPDLAGGRSVGGHEPGHNAINAPALWAMGYTGHGTRALIYDTGIRPKHPAVRERFIHHFRPDPQGWKAVDSPFPVDKVNHHGTHVAGIVLGLDPATNDTIGSAFNAYFMATDPIVSDHSKIKPLPVYISVYEWAFNPDGDTNTTDDVPQVINNSWGIASQDSTLCQSFASDMFDALEAAGIAVVFSAGNNGPDSATIGRPAFIASGLVNIFSVGAVDGNNPAFPIANFSSRGPTICPVTGALKIKPEVVAPGVGVRSAVSDSGYAFYNGTSMAGPHASGAALLLKEAFPFLSGEDILLALYNTAVDLGTPGEDNTYGRGIIDVEAAFNYLALSHTPVPPKSREYDLAVTAILSEVKEFYCDTTITVTFEVANLGDSTALYPWVSAWLDGVQKDYLALTELLPGQRDTITQTIQGYNRTGLHEAWVRIDWNGPVDEYDVYNNQRMVRFDFRGEPVDIQVWESLDIDTVNLFGGSLLVSNPQGGITWDTTTIGITGPTDRSLILRWSEYLPRAGQEDYLYFPQVGPTFLQASLSFDFDYFYRTKHQFFKDSLFVEISFDCGLSWQKLFENGGVGLDSYSSGPNDPSDPANWKHISLAIPNSNDKLIRFRGVNDNGGDLYIDNIELILHVGVQTPFSSNLTLFPNPASSRITFTLPKQLAGRQYFITDLTGRTVAQGILAPGGNTHTVGIGQLASGLYLLQILTSDGAMQGVFVKGS